jgi:hypothetical protein
VNCSALSHDYEFEFIDLTLSLRFPQSNGFGVAGPKIEKGLLKHTFDWYKGFIDHCFTALSNGFSSAELHIRRPPPVDFTDESHSSCATSIGQVSLVGKIVDTPINNGFRRTVRRKGERRAPAGLRGTGKSFLLLGYFYWEGSSLFHGEVTTENFRRNTHHLVQAYISYESFSASCSGCVVKVASCQL